MTRTTPPLPLGAETLFPELSAHRSATTAVRVGRDGELKVFTCPNDPAHPTRWAIQ
ncbi:hypothetical protein ACIHEI_04320 [Kitasatospora sp. NPDC051984]|uniref:hypothetical protein n=1 Tax=Kitasatospora sp. NPDC051984 TaxID=3364059 RepID=UPI0037CAE11B